MTLNMVIIDDCYSSSIIRGSPVFLSFFYNIYIYSLPYLLYNIYSLPSLQYLLTLPYVFTLSREKVPSDT